MGADMVQPMAVVTIGGLIYGTILTLVVEMCIRDRTGVQHLEIEEEFEKSLPCAEKLEERNHQHCHAANWTI